MSFDVSPYFCMPTLETPFAKDLSNADSYVNDRVSPSVQAESPGKSMSVGRGRTEMGRSLGRHRTYRGDGRPRDQVEQGTWEGGPNTVSSR